MFVSELNNKSVEELNTELANLLRQQFNQKLMLKTGSLKDVSVLKKTRRDIARMMTILTEKKNAN